MSATTERSTRHEDPFTVAKTYETWDEESLEIGETDDHGYEYEDTPMSLGDTLREIRNGCWDGDDAGEDFYAGVRFYSADNEVNYRTGETTRYCLHIRASARAIRRLRQCIEGNIR